MSVSCQADIKGCGSFPAETVFLAEGHQVVSGSMDVSVVVSPVFSLLPFFWTQKILLGYWSLFLMSFSFKKRQEKKNLLLLLLLLPWLWLACFCLISSLPLLCFALNLTLHHSLPLFACPTCRLG